MRGALLVLSIITAIILAGVDDAFALHSGEYFAEDDTAQRSAQGTENFVSHVWGLSTNRLGWWAESQIRSDVLVAINRWATAAPGLTWVEAANQNSAEVVFRTFRNTCGGFFGSQIASSCFNITEFIFEPDRNASYWKKAEIRVNRDQAKWGRQGLERIAALAHEIGHVYGLHERYYEQTGACNDDPLELTIMDTATTQSPPWFHCDGIDGPAAIDKDRVTAYWSGQCLYARPSPPFPQCAPGRIANLTHIVGDPVVTYQWKDEGWAEYEQRLEWQYSSDGGYTWTSYHSRAKTDNVGVHRITALEEELQERTLQEVVDRTVYGAPGGLHRMCAQLYYIAWNATTTPPGLL